MKHGLLSLLLILPASLATGCLTSEVGAPCLPDVVPAGGFDPAETYLETASPSCETRYCLVRGLDGDPRPDCVGDRCAPDDEVRAHVYCTSTCQQDGDCGAGFVCEDLGIAGSFCVLDELSSGAP